jgi:hypothetical protein
VCPPPIKKIGGNGTRMSCKNYDMNKYSFHTHMAKLYDLKAGMKNWTTGHKHNRISVSENGHF